MASFIFALLANLWIWRIIFVYPLVALVSVMSSYSLYKLLTEKKLTRSFFISFALLLILQYSTTHIHSLTQLSEQEKIIQRERLNAYPPIQIAGHYIPIAHWLEERTESIVFYRMLDNVSEVLDPNLYFFANHPRERPTVKEFEKFPYLFLPFFFYGLIQVSHLNKRTLIAVGAVPLILVAVIGNDNPFGPFVLFPLFIVAISIGLHEAYVYVKNKIERKKKQVTSSK